MIELRARELTAFHDSRHAIDGYNQKRNDAIERTDEQLLNFFSNIKIKPESKLNSETPGAMVDRLLGRKNQASSFSSRS